MVILIVQRHGQGYHNAAELRYGPLWDSYWSFQEGDEHGSWEDALLTPLGEQQARDQAQLAHALVLQYGRPRAFFCSPMRRCLQTLARTWGPVDRVVVIEELRERLGVHACDRRVPHSQVQQELLHHDPAFHYGDAYPEEDQLWQPDHRETEHEMDLRLRGPLRRILSTGSDGVVSITCHSGVIRSLQRIMGVPEAKIQPAGVMCVEVDADGVATRLV